MKHWPWLVVAVAVSIHLGTHEITIQKLEAEISNARPIPLTKSLGRRTTNTPEAPRTDSARKTAIITAFSSVEFCRTNYALKTHPNCNGNTFPKDSVAIRYEWIRQGYTSVYIPKYAKSYRIIGRTDGKTDIDIWFGDDQADALQIGKRYETVYLSK